MPGLVELHSEQDVTNFQNQHDHCVVTFSAHWCGPCKASKPQLEQLALSSTSTVQIGIVYENDLGDAVADVYRIRAFPTYILYQKETEIQRVEGANISKVQEMISNAAPSATSVFETGTGETLGGGSGNSNVDPRAMRLARLGGGNPAATAANDKKDDTATPMEEEDDTKKPPAKETTTAEAAEDDAAATAAKKEDGDDDDDVEMKDAAEEKVEVVDPTAKLDPGAIQTLTENMGFALIRAQKGLLYGNGGTVEGAVEWLMEHQDDVDIDEPIPAGVAQKAQSYKCNECGKVLSNMANLELHANKTGHSDFEESTQQVQPLTAEEKAQKIAEIKELLKLKRAEREEAEKVDDTEREKQRRNMGKEIAKTREQLDMEQRKREAYLRKKEKEEFKKERQRLRAELAKDKKERAAQGGKLSSKLSVEGYKPDGVQYDVDAEGGGGGGEAEEVAAAANAAASTEHKQKKLKADAGRIDEYITKVSSYRAGGDGGKCLKILKIYIGNVVDNPNEEKYKTINMENKAFKTKVKPFIGAKNILLACGFQPTEDGLGLHLCADDVNEKVLKETKEKLEKALVAYG